MRPMLKRALRALAVALRRREREEVQVDELAQMLLAIANHRAQAGGPEPDDA